MPIFAHPWGLVALAALPAILALHLFWQRFRPRRVSGLFLWAPEAKQILAGRTRERLYRTASLLLELFAALALALAAAAPSTVSATRKRHVVIVLDGSASMSAVGADGRTFAEAAAGEARSRLAGLGPSWRDHGDEATVIVSGPVPELAAGPRAPPAAALDAIDTYLGEPGEPGTPFAETGELEGATALARELAPPDGRVLVLTDTPRPPDLVPADVEFVSVGEPRRNVGFVVARRTARPGAGRSREGEERVFVCVRNFSDGPADCALVFRLDDGQEVRRGLSLAPGQTAPVALPLGPETGPVVVELEVDPAANALALDDRVTLVPSPRPDVAVANLLEGEARLALERALASVPGTNPAEPSAAALVFSPGGEEDGPLSPAVDAWRVVITGSSGEKPLRFAGPYCPARDDPLLEDVSLEGVLWTASGRGVPEGARPLISCGDHVLGSRSGDRIVLDVDLARSNLARTAAWPVLVSNIVEELRRALPGLEKTNLALGETARLSLGTLDSEPVLVTARGRKRLPGAGLKRHFLAHTLGAGEIRHGGDRQRGDRQRGDRPPYVFHVNFLSPEESDLSALGKTRVPARQTPAPEEPTVGDEARWPVTLLAALALAAAVGDWYVLRNGRPQRSQRLNGMT